MSLVPFLKIIRLCQKFIDRKIDSKHFYYAFWDIYWFEIFDLKPKNKTEEKIKDLLLDFREFVSYFSLIPYSKVEHPYLKNKNELIKESKNFIEKMNKIILSNNVTYAYNCDGISPFDQIIEKIIFIINDYKFLENKIFIKKIETLNSDLKPTTDPQKKVKETISAYLKLMKKSLYSQRQKTLKKKDLLKEVDQLWELGFELKKFLYFYLNKI